jgi:hypothetical protein
MTIFRKALFDSTNIPIYRRSSHIIDLAQDQTPGALADTEMDIKDLSRYHTLVPNPERIHAFFDAVANALDTRITDGRIR